MLTRQHALKDSEKKEPKSTQISSSDKAKMSKNRKDDNTNECSKKNDQKEHDMNKMDKMFEIHDGEIGNSRRNQGAHSMR
jgi:hypothetical protein